MIEREKTILKLEARDTKIEIDISEYDIHQFMDAVIKIATAVTYHPVSIYNGLKEASYSMEELFDSIKYDKSDSNDKDI